MRDKLLVLGLLLNFGLALSAHATSSLVKMEADQIFPVDVLISSGTQQVQLSNPRNAFEVRVKFVNKGPSRQYVGTENCGAHQIDVRSNDPQFYAEETWCRQNISPPTPVYLDPGEVYEQLTHVQVSKKAVAGSVDLKLGLKLPGYQETWSNPIRIEIE